MKFQCDGCKTRYSIADEKVRGKVLKIRCKTCAAVITVRDAAVAAPRLTAEPVPAAGPVTPMVSATGGRRVARAASQTIQLSGVSAPVMAATPAARPARDGTNPRAMLPEANVPEEWYLSIDGHQEGPLTPDQARARVSKKAPSVEMFAWRDDFEEWLPVEEVPVLAVHLPRRRGGTVPPAPMPEATPPPQLEGAAPTASLPVSAEAAPAAADEHPDFQIGEASRLVKLPILPPPPGRSGSDGGLPGVSASTSDPRADSSLKLNIVSLSTEMVAAAPPSSAANASGNLSAPAPRPRRKLSLAFIVGAVAAVALIAVVVVVLGMGGDQAAPQAPAGDDSVLVTNFYKSDNPLFKREPANGKTTTTEAAEGEEEAIEIEPEAAAAEPSKTRRPRRVPSASTNEPLVALAPGTPRSDPPRMGAAPRREKVDSFGGGVDDELGPLTPDDVRSTYGANEVGLKRCYERSLKSDPAASTVSKMVVKITITPAGTVSDITVPDKGSDLGACVAGSIKNWRFRKSTGEFTTEFTVFFAKRG